MTWAKGRLWPPTTVGRLRFIVLASATLTTALKLAVAATTFGTNDVHHWIEFADAVRRYGPVGIYGQELRGLYNHPPLSGWLLVVINWLVDLRLAEVPFLIRVPASVADIVTAALMFELVRQRRSPREAATAGLFVAFSPVLFVVSGFHGNTDPLFVMLSLLSVYLLAVRRWAAASGVAIATALSVKLVPVVLIPALLVAVARGGLRRFTAFAVGATSVFLVLWGPVVLTRWPEFRAQVLSYQGIPVREWGIVQFATWAHLPNALIDDIVGEGRFVVLALCALIPLLIVWRRPAALAPAAGLGLVLFLLLSTAFGTQYLSWAVAGAYLVSTWAATAYNLVAGAMVVVVYDRWNQAYPWNWSEAKAQRLVFGEFVLMVITWAALALVAVLGMRLLLGRDAAGPDGGNGQARDGASGIREGGGANARVPLGRWIRRL